MKVGIIGTGNIGKALADRMLEREFEVFLSSSRKGEYKGVEILDDNIELAKACDVILLSLEPKSVREVLEEIKEHVREKTLISFAAGLKLETYESMVGARVARAMPNLAIKNGEGVCFYKLGKDCKKENVEGILGNLGLLIETKDENVLDIVASVSGSGIALLVRITNNFIEAAKQGMEEGLARKVVLETVKGAVGLMERNNNSQEIIDCVSSKGGITEQVMEELDDRNFDEILTKPLLGAIEKAKELGGRDG